MKIANKTVLTLVFLSLGAFLIVLQPVATSAQPNESDEIYISLEELNSLSTDLEVETISLESKAKKKKKKKKKNSKKKKKNTKKKNKKKNDKDSGGPSETLTFLFGSELLYHPPTCATITQYGGLLIEPATYVATFSGKTKDKIGREVNIPATAYYPALSGHGYVDLGLEVEGTGTIVTDRGAEQYLYKLSTIESSGDNYFQFHVAIYILGRAPGDSCRSEIYYIYERQS